MPFLALALRGFPAHTSCVTPRPALLLAAALSAAPAGAIRLGAEHVPAAPRAPRAGPPVAGVEPGSWAPLVRNGLGALLAPSGLSPAQEEALSAALALTGHAPDALPTAHEAALLREALSARAVWDAADAAGILREVRRRAGMRSRMPSFADPSAAAAELDLGERYDDAIARIALARALAGTGALDAFAERHLDYAAAMDAAGEASIALAEDLVNSLEADAKRRGDSSPVAASVAEEIAYEEADRGRRRLDEAAEALTGRPLEPLPSLSAPRPAARADPARRPAAAGPAGVSRRAAALREHAALLGAAPAPREAWLSALSGRWMLGAPAERQGAVAELLARTRLDPARLEEWSAAQANDRPPFPRTVVMRHFAREAVIKAMLDAAVDARFGGSAALREPGNAAAIEAALALRDVTGWEPALAVRAAERLRRLSGDADEARVKRLAAAVYGVLSHEDSLEDSNGRPAGVNPDDPAVAAQREILERELAEAPRPVPRAAAPLDPPADPADAALRAAWGQ